MTHCAIKHVGKCRTNVDTIHAIKCILYFFCENKDQTFWLSPRVSCGSVCLIILQGPHSTRHWCAQTWHLIIYFQNSLWLTCKELSVSENACRWPVTIKFESFRKLSLKRFVSILVQSTGARNMAQERARRHPWGSIQARDAEEQGFIATYGKRGRIVQVETRENRS